MIDKLPGWAAFVALVIASPAVGAPACPVAHLSRALLAGDSATAVLQTVCAGRSEARIVARPLANRPEPAPPAWVRAALASPAAEPVQYRRVELMCGGDVLSTADNWYLPAHLTPAMNRRLLETQTPFGVVAQPLGFHRRPIAVQALARCNARPGPATGVLRLRAVLVDRRRRPFSVVQETYSAAALAR